MKRFVSKLSGFLFGPDFGFLLILTYLSFINFFVIKSTPDIIFLQFALLVIFFKSFRSKNFAKVWIPFIAMFVLYEFLRSFADNVSPFYNYTFYDVYKFEKFVFGVLPTIALQKIFPPSHLFVQLSLFFYSMFFYYSFLVAFIIWVKNEDQFKTYSSKFIILTYISLLVFFLFPTAPPWLVAKAVSLPISRYLIDSNILQGFASLTIYNYFLNGNAVAAFPSLHAAWPMFTTLFLLKNFKNLFLWLLLFIPLMIGFCVVVAGEHYVVDVVTGFLLAMTVVFWADLVRLFRGLKLGLS